MSLDSKDEKTTIDYAGKLRIIYSSKHACVREMCETEATNLEQKRLHLSANDCRRLKFLARNLQIRGVNIQTVCVLLCFIEQTLGNGYILGARVSSRLRAVIRQLE